LHGLLFIDGSWREPGSPNGFEPRIAAVANGLIDVFPVHAQAESR
jgi:hypothetical protein